MASATFEEFLVQLGRQIGAKNRKILLFIDQCAAHAGVTTALKNIIVIFSSPNCTSHLQPVDMGIIHAFKCQYRKQCIWDAKAVNEGEILGDAGSLGL
jgi:hypothetical protein